MASARTIAYPIRWVKEIFPPRPRARWLLITMRLSTRSLAGTARTLVAVGPVGLAAMLPAVLAPTPPRRTGPPVATPPRPRPPPAAAPARPLTAAPQPP